MTKIEPRKPQTKVKHIILREYLDSWGGIIINGLRGRSVNLHFVYVDCNASNGRFNGELEDVIAHRETRPVFGSPIVGIQALDKHANWVRNIAGINLRTNTILIEKNPKTFSELKKSLEMAGLTDRIRETDAFNTLHNGEIAILCEDSTTISARLINYTQSGTKFSFFFLDPYGPTGIPLSFVKEIIRQPKHDVIINMPYQDLHKKRGIVTKSDLLSGERELISHYDDMFGHKKWQDIARDLYPNAIWEEDSSYINVQSESKAEELELKLMGCYRETLQNVDQKLVVKSIGLRFPDRERTMYYLYLTTHDPTGALKMNKVLWEAWHQEHELRWEFIQSKKRKSQLALFEYPAPPLETPPRASIEEIANHILLLLTGKIIARKGIYTTLANELYFAEEIDRALRFLRKQQKAFFNDPLGNDTRIKLGHV